MSDNPRTAPNPTVDVEESDVNIGWLTFGIIILFVALVVSMILSFWFLGGLEDYRTATEPTPLPLIEMRPTPPVPRLQPNPIDRKTAEQELLEMIEREEEILTSYDWVNERDGIIRIPIDEAIDILVEQDEPAR